MKKRISLALVCSCALFLFAFTAPVTAQASSPNIYESMTGTHNGAMDGVAGSSNSVGLTSISGVVRKGISSTISVNVNAPGFVRFFDNGKRIPSCLRVATSGSSPNFTASCTWKHAAQGARTFSASFTPSDSTFLAANSAPTVYQITNRTNRR